MFIKEGVFPFKNTYCISLKSSEGRRKHIAKELSKQKIEYQLVDAITKDDFIVEEAYSSGLVKLYPSCFRCGEAVCDCENNVLLPAQVATFFSHKKVWGIIAEEPEGMYLVIEDDIKFNFYYNYMKKRFFDKIEFVVSSNIQEPLLLRLAWARNKDHRIGKVRLEENLLKMSNPMYSLNPKMARVLLNKFKKITMTVDSYVHKEVGFKHKNFTLFPPLAHELSWSTGDMESLIRPRKKRLKKLRGKLTKGSKVKQELKKYDQHIDRAIDRKLLAIGHPRTGSGYTSAILKSFGLDVGHEKMGADGVASWMFTVYDLNNPFSLNKYARSKYYTSFENVIMFVRDPFTAIPSIIRENSSSDISYEFRRKHTLKELEVDLNDCDSSFEKAINGYYLWSKIGINNNAPELVFRVECDEELLFSFLKGRGLNVFMKEDAIPEKNINSNKTYKGKIIDKPLITEGDWLGLNTEFKLKLNEMCDSFNYEKIFSDDLSCLIR